MQLYLHKFLTYWRYMFLVKLDLISPSDFIASGIVIEMLFFFYKVFVVIWITYWPWCWLTADKSMLCSTIAQLLYTELLLVEWAELSSRQE
jgi:hypothetical protein